VILYFTETFEIARSHLSEAEFTSNIESDGEDFEERKRQRKIRRVILPGEECSSSDDEDSQPPKQMKPTTITTFPPHLLLLPSLTPQQNISKNIFTTAR
jgi:hypothetical protein